MTTNNLSPEKQLQLIQSTIAQAKENLSNHSFPFLFWGWLVSFTALINFLLLSYSSFGEKSYLIWPVSMVFGAIYIVLYYRKAEKTERHLTHLEYFLSRLWMVLGAILLLFSFCNNLLYKRCNLLLLAWSNCILMIIAFFAIYLIFFFGCKLVGF